MSQAGGQTATAASRKSPPDSACPAGGFLIPDSPRMTHLSRAALLAIFSLLWFKASGAISVQIGQNFTASRLNTDIFETPPDADGTVGPAHFVQFINGRFSVYDKITGTNVQNITDRTFWAAAGIDLSGLSISDPRIIYDKSVGRWFASQVDFDGNNLSSNRFLLAVSSTNDPTATWNAVAFQADPGGSFADYPTLGLDANGVYLGGNMFDPNENLLGVLLTSIPKADLLQATPTATNRSTTGLMTIMDRGFTLQPVVNLSPSSAAENVIAVESDGTDFQFHSILKSFQVLNSAAANAAFTPSTNLTVPQYFVALDPPQPDGQSTLSDGDTRIGAIVRQVGDIIYAVHSTQGVRTAVRWYKISALDNTILQSGTISDTNLHLFYPSIAANESGLVVIAFNGCSTNTFVSSYAVVGETINGTTTFGNLMLLKAGVANYEVPGGGAESRWGDYSATSVDPLNPNNFWTIQMFASANNVWSTQVTELRITPVLQIASAAANVVLSWPTNVTGFALQSTTNLTSALWTSVTNGVSIVGAQNTVTVAAGVPTQFFRLKE